MRAAWLLIPLLLLGCPQKAGPQQDPNVVATVNGEAITRAAFELELAREAQAMEGLASRTPEQIEPYKQTLLDTMMQRTLLLQAARAQGIAVTPEEVDRRVLALASEYPAGSFDDALAKNETNRAELARRTREQLLVEHLFEQQVFARIAATEDQIRRYFDEHPDEFMEAEQVRAQQIVVKGLDDAKRVQSLLYQGKKFSELARRHSLSPDAKVGGDLGFFKKGEMPPAFDEVVFRLSVGQVSEIVTTEYGYHLFKLVEKKPARKRELADVRAQVEARVVAGLREEREKDFITQLRSKAELKVNDRVLPLVTGRVSAGESPEP